MRLLRRSLLHIVFCWPHSINTPYPWVMCDLVQLRLTGSHKSCELACVTGSLAVHSSLLWLIVRERRLLHVDCFLPFIEQGACGAGRRAARSPQKRRAVHYGSAAWARLWPSGPNETMFQVDASSTSASPKPFQQQSPASRNSMLQ